MLLNLAFSAVPRPLTTAMMATEIPAAIKPYSMAVAPDSHLIKERNNPDIRRPSRWLSWKTLGSIHKWHVNLSYSDFGRISAGKFHPCAENIRGILHTELAEIGHPSEQNRPFGR